MVDVTPGSTPPSADDVPAAPQPVPAKTPAPAPAAKAAMTSSIATARALAASAPSATDAFLSHLNRCLATPSGVDTVLLVLCYTSKLTASGLTAAAAATQLALLRRRGAGPKWAAVIASSAQSSVTTTILAAPVSSAGPVSSKLAASLLVLAGRLKALGGLASEARMIMRLWALLGMYLWARGLVRKTLGNLAAVRRHHHELSNTKNEKETKGVATTAAAAVAEARAAAPQVLPLADAVSYAQLLACVLFQALENGAYLSARGVLGWTPPQQARAFRWSARFWAVYVGAELGRLAAESVARRQRRRRPGQGQKDAALMEEEEKEASWLGDWRKQVARNLAWAPLTLHWSTERGLVSEAVVALLGSVPGVIQMRDLWRDTA